MLVWRGWGILAFILAMASFAVVGATGLPQPYSGLLSGAVAAAAIWFTGRRLNDPAKDRLVTDAATGEMLRLRSRHDLFWIPMQWWAIPAALFGVVLAFGK